MRTITIACLCLLLALPAAAVWVEYLEEDSDQIPIRWYAVPDGSGLGSIGARMARGLVWNQVFRIRPHVDDMPSFPPVEELLPPDFPLEDIFLVGPNLGRCAVNTCPDYIDEDGWVYWEQPLHAGGSAFADDLEFCIDGYTEEMPSLEFVSSDFNEDLDVNLSDITPFVASLEGSYDQGADFNWDGVIDLSDVVLMVRAIGTVCQEGTR